MPTQTSKKKIKFTKQKQSPKKQTNKEEQKKYKTLQHLHQWKKKQIQSSIYEKRKHKDIVFKTIK